MDVAWDRSTRATPVYMRDNFKEGAKPTSSKPRRSGGGGGSRRSKKQDDGRKIKVTNTNDPLAGVD